MNANELLSIKLSDCEAPNGQAFAGRENHPPKEKSCLFSVRARELSSWSQSREKRLFDVFCVLLSLPALIPILLLIALVVCMTSRGPVLFLQKRVGRNGQVFSILKFRTMVSNQGVAQCLVTTRSDQRFTSVGPFLRKWKLDELPQLLNVLFGQMSLVGPRPKVPEHEPFGISCRPGITGAATVAFAREEQTLDEIPRKELNEFYNDVVLPAKREIDAEYMACASFQSDLSLLFDSLFGRWDQQLMEAAIERHSVSSESTKSERKFSLVRETLRTRSSAMRVVEVGSIESDSVA